MNKHAPVWCVVLGASTGGPDALVKVLKEWHGVSSACMLIVQHLEASLSGHLAAWLSEQSGVHVQQPQGCYQLQAGEVVLLTGQHWVMNACQSLEAYAGEVAGMYAMPSIDVMMNSVAEHWQQKAAGVLLTGMGKDGAKGLLAMRQRGWDTYAQDEASCVVYGMPKSAVHLQAVAAVKSPEDIGALLRQRIQYHALVAANQG